MLEVNRRYDLLKQVIEKFEKQNCINPKMLIMELSDDIDEKEFLEELFELLFFG